MTSLVDLLEGDHDVSEILEVFREYAGEASIGYHTVKQILARAEMSPDELLEAYDIMQEGLVNRLKAGNLISGLEYLQAMNHIAKLRAGMKISGVSSVGAEGDDDLSVLKPRFVAAHLWNDPEQLFDIIGTFKEYVRKQFPIFAQDEPSVDLVGSGTPHLGIKAYTVDGKSVTPRQYLNSIRATDQMEITRWKKPE